MFSIFITVAISIVLSIWGNIISGKMDSSVFALYNSKKFLFDNLMRNTKFKGSSPIGTTVSIILVASVMYWGFYELISVRKVPNIGLIYSILMFVLLTVFTTYSTRSWDSDFYDKLLVYLLAVMAIGYIDLGIIEYLYQAQYTIGNISKIIALIMSALGSFTLLLSLLSIELIRMKEYLETKLVFVLDNSTKYLYHCKQPIGQMSFSNYVCHIRDGKKHFLITSTYEIFVVNKDDHDLIARIKDRVHKSVIEII